MTKDLREEARELAQGILRNLELQEIPLSSILLRCRRLARLIEDEAAYTWFGYELNGYPCSDGVVEDNAFQIALAHGRETGRNENGPLVTVSTIAELETRASTQELQLHQEREPDIHHVPANQYDTLPWRTGSLIRGQLAKEITAARTLLTVA